MEVAEKDTQIIKQGKRCRKKCRLTFWTRFMITSWFKKRRSSEDSKYDLAKAAKLEMLTILSTKFDLGMILQV